MKCKPSCPTPGPCKLCGQIGKCCKQGSDLPWHECDGHIGGKDQYECVHPQDDTDSKGGSCDEPNPAANIEDNNLLGDTYFDVKSDHCL